MNPGSIRGSSLPSASEYIFDSFEPSDRIALLLLNRDFDETISASPAHTRHRAPSFRHGCATRMPMGRTFMLRGIEPAGLFFLLPPVGFG